MSTDRVECTECGGSVDVWRLINRRLKVCYKCLPVVCVQCGGAVEEARYCYAHPTCYKCLPPPPPLDALMPNAD